MKCPPQEKHLYILKPFLLCRPNCPTQIIAGSGQLTEHLEPLEHQTSPPGDTDSVHFQNSVKGKCCRATEAHKPDES